MSMPFHNLAMEHARGLKVEQIAVSDETTSERVHWCVRYCYDGVYYYLAQPLILNIL
jgi:hypothetical protein